jgi:hypothetical protein
MDSGLVRVFNPHIIRAVLAPFEGQAPLSVDAYMPSTVLLLQIVCRRRPHEVYRRGSVELCQLALGNALNVDEPKALARNEQGIGVSACKRLDRHKKIICYPDNGQYGVLIVRERELAEFVLKHSMEPLLPHGPNGWIHLLA